MTVPFAFLRRLFVRDEPLTAVERVDEGQQARGAFDVAVAIGLFFYGLGTLRGAQ